jgi:hypothetical protein
MVLGANEMMNNDEKMLIHLKWKRKEQRRVRRAEIEESWSGQRRQLVN